MFLIAMMTRKSTTSWIRGRWSRSYASPPEGFVRGTSGALFSSGEGHLVYSVSAEADRTTPGWIDRIQVARANPDGSTTVLPALGIEQRGVNASGMVIGDGPDTTSAWRYTDAGGWKNLGSLNASGYAQPKAINDAGTVVGRSSSADGYFTPFLYTDSGGMQTFTDGTGNELFGEATAINNNGLIAGTANGRAFVFNGSTMEFNFLTPEVEQKVVDINSTLGN
jgi:probable HAF family extracellular repeat protein